MQEVLGEDRDLHSVQLQRNMLATFNSMLVSSLEPLVSTFTDRQQEILNESGYTDLTRNCNQIINCAMLLSLGYIREATTYAESCGGGSPGSGWGRDNDKDYEHWWRRCIAVSAAMMRPAFLLLYSIEEAFVFFIHYFPNAVFSTSFSDN